MGEFFQSARRFKETCVKGRGVVVALIAVGKNAKHYTMAASTKKKNPFASPRVRAIC